MVLVVCLQVLKTCILIKDKGKDNISRVFLVLVRKWVIQDFFESVFTYFKLVEHSTVRGRVCNNSRFVFAVAEAVGVFWYSE